MLPTYLFADGKEDGETFGVWDGEVYCCPGDTGGEDCAVAPPHAETELNRSKRTNTSKNHNLLYFAAIIISY